LLLECLISTIFNVFEPISRPKSFLSENII
jgi:hypothetical protein